MFLFHLIFFFYFFIETVISDNNEKAQTDELNVYNLSMHLNTLVNYLNDSNSNISKQCIDNFKNYYNNSLTNLKKIYEGSSKSFVDLNSFTTCINFENHTFFTIYPNLTGNSKREVTKLITKLDKKLTEHLWIFGVCFLEGKCDSTQIGNIFDALNKLFSSEFKYYTSENITILDYNTERAKYLKGKVFVRNFYPFFFIIIQIIFMIFKIIPVTIFGFFLKRKYLKELDKKVNNQKENIDDLINTFSLSNQVALKIRKCFSITEIVEDLVYSEKSELFKDKDMTYLKGMKTLGIIFLIFGFSFIILYNYPLCLSGADERKKYLKSRQVIYLNYCFRLSTAILLSTSGFSLSYKFLNFLDKKLANIIPDGSLPLNNDENNKEKDNTNNKSDEEKLDNIDKTEEKIEVGKSIESSGVKGTSSTNDEYYENTFGIKFYNKDIVKSTLNKMFEGQKVNEITLLSQITTDKIPTSIYFNFILRQIHKLFFLLFGIAMFKYAFPIFLVLIGRSPLIHHLFKTFFENLSVYLLNIIFVGNIIDLFNIAREKEPEKFFITKLFCIPISEFNYFIFCTILIFVCYKKKFRLDIILVVLIFIFLTFKTIFITTQLEDMNPGMFYTDTDYQKFFFNPIFNFDFFLIGMFFGMMNYVVQNGIEKKKLLIKERPFVKLPIFLLKYTDYHKNKNVFRFIFMVLLLVVSLHAISFFFRFGFKSIIQMENDKNQNIAFVIISLFDIEFFIFSFHFVLLSSYISGRNILFRIFNSQFSSYWMKLSYWLVFGIPTFSYLIIYMNEANLKLSFYIVIIYSAIIFINSSIIALLLFLFMEMPYKKLIKLYFNISSEINKLYLEKDDGNNDLDSGIGLADLNEKDTLDDDIIEDAKKIKNDEEEDDIKDD